MTPSEAGAVERLREAFNGMPTGFRVHREEDWTGGQCVDRLQVYKPAGPFHWKLVATIEAAALN